MHMEGQTITPKLIKYKQSLRVRFNVAGHIVPWYKVIVNQNIRRTQ